MRRVGAGRALTGAIFIVDVALHKPVLDALLFSLIDLAAGVIALAWPGPTALVLVRRTGKTLDSAVPKSSRPEPMALTVH